MPHRHKATIAFAGQSLGRVTEALTRTPTGFQLQRHVRFEYHRESTLIASEMRIRIDVARDLRARSIVVHHNWPNGIVDRAYRTGNAWTFHRAGEAPAMGDSAAAPLELLPYFIDDIADKRTRPVVISDRRLALSHLAVHSVSPRRYRLELSTATVPIQSELELFANATVKKITGPGRFVETVCSPCTKKLDAPDILAATRIPVQRTPESVPLVRVNRLHRSPVATSGQLITGTSASWTIRDVTPAIDSMEIRALKTMVDIVSRKIRRDLAAPTWSPDSTRAHNAEGDCTTFSLRYQKLAEQRGYPTRLVTGWRIGPTHAIRHRWAITRTANGWIAVDPSFGEAPATPHTLIALTVHDADAVSLATADLVFAGTESTQISAPSTPRF